MELRNEVRVKIELSEQGAETIPSTMICTVNLCIDLLNASLYNFKSKLHSVLLQLNDYFPYKGNYFFKI